MLAPSQQSQSAQGSSIRRRGRKVLSCTSCRRRKIKCDKNDPCDSCLDNGLDCVFPVRRARASQNKSASLEARDTELLRRLKHLEEIIAKNGMGLGPAQLDSAGIQNPAFDAPLSKSNAPSDRTQYDVAIDKQYAAFVKQQGSRSRHLSGDFWSSLSNEFDSLRQLLEGEAHDDDEVDDSLSYSTELRDSESPRFILQNVSYLDDSDISQPSDAHMAILFRSFFTNVDPICKILHRPTAYTYFSNANALMNPSTRRFKFRRLDAVTFAMYFAAISSMSSEECLLHLGEQKTDLVARHKCIAEKALVQANYLNTLEISTLQALTIYIVAQRCLHRACDSWTLIGLAVRIAHGFGLHRDGDGRAFGAFEAEMRRRLWWQIMALDIRASDDRGFERILPNVSPSHTIMPCNLDDDDFEYQSVHPLHSKAGPTETTASLFTIEALNTGQNLIYSFVGGEPDNTPLEEKAEHIKTYARRVEACLANSDFSNPRTKFLSILGHYWTNKLWLMLYYPLHHEMPAAQVQSQGCGLQTAMTFLQYHQLLEEHSTSASFTWVFQTYAPWHAVVVVLAEICRQPQGVLADRAWRLVQHHFADWSGRTADVKELILWGPIKKLLKRAERARESVRGSSNGMLKFSDSDAISDSFEVPNTQRSAPGSITRDVNTDFQTVENLSSLDHLMHQSLDYSPSTPAETVATQAELLPLTYNFDGWNDFMFDVHALGNDPERTFNL